MPPVILAPYITRDHEIRYGSEKSAVSFSGCMSTDDHTAKLYLQSGYMHGWNLYMFPGTDVYEGLYVSGRCDDSGVFASTS